MAQSALPELPALTVKEDGPACEDNRVAARRVATPATDSSTVMPVAVMPVPVIVTNDASTTRPRLTTLTMTSKGCPMNPAPGETYSHTGNVGLTHWKLVIVAKARCHDLTRVASSQRGRRHPHPSQPLVLVIVVRQNLSVCLLVTPAELGLDFRVPLLLPPQVQNSHVEEGRQEGVVVDALRRHRDHLGRARAATEAEGDGLGASARAADPCPHVLARFARGGCEHEARLSAVAKLHLVHINVIFPHLQAETVR
eukprot:3938543-Rhodomonas_salina.1